MTTQAPATSTATTTATTNNESVSLGSIWGVAKRSTLRTLNTLDMATAMAERTVDYANQSNKAWSVEASIKRNAANQALAKQYGISDDELAKLLA